MYSVVMVVAMAGAPEVPSDCCFKDKFCCWKDKWQDKCGWKDKCGQKDYGRANDCAPVAVAPVHAAPVAVAPVHQAPVAVAPVYVQQSNECCDKGYSKKKCCFFSCCDKGYSNNNNCGKSSSKGCCDKGYSNNNCGKSSGKGCCDKGSSNNDCGKSKKCCFFSCCDKGGETYYAPAPACGTVVVPPTVDAPKKDMPKVDPKGGKIGG